jgi:hypothetical protein
MEVLVDEGSEKTKPNKANLETEHLEFAYL